jgi:hypothetical protein
MSVFELPITKMFGLTAMRDSGNETMNGSKDQERTVQGEKSHSTEASGKMEGWKIGNASALQDSSKF